MSQVKDILTAGLSRASDILFVQNPKGTSVGAFCGVAADGLLKLFSPTLNRLREWMDLTQLNVFYLMAAGVVLFNIPLLFRRRQLPNSIEDAFEVVRRMKKEGASATQVRLQMLAISQAVVEQVKIDQEKMAAKARAGNYLREKF